METKWLTKLVTFKELLYFVWTGKNDTLLLPRSRHCGEDGTSDIWLMWTPLRWVNIIEPNLSLFSAPAFWHRNCYVTWRHVSVMLTWPQSECSKVPTLENNSSGALRWRFAQHLSPSRNILENKKALNPKSCFNSMLQSLQILEFFFLQWFAAVTIQAVWRGYLVRSQLQRQPVEPWDPQRNTAATVIQVKWTLNRLRVIPSRQHSWQFGDHMYRFTNEGGSVTEW